MFALLSVLMFNLLHQASDNEKRGNIAAARAKANISLGLNIAAVVFIVVMWSVVAIPIAVTLSTASCTVSPTSVSPSQYCFQFVLLHPVKLLHIFSRSSFYILLQFHLHLFLCHIKLLFKWISNHLFSMQPKLLPEMRVNLTIANAG